MQKFSQPTKSPRKFQKHKLDVVVVLFHVSLLISLGLLNVSDYRCFVFPAGGSVLTQFDAGDPQGPDVHFPLILTLVHG